jgi:glycolate oxidase
METAYAELSEDDVCFFRSILGETHAVMDLEILEENSRDYTEDLQFLPSVVLYPASAEEVSQVMAYCHQRVLPVTCRGAGTGLSGGCLPVMGGVVLNMKRMNRIKRIDVHNFQVEVEPGVINRELKNAVEPYGLFYPPDPASSDSCFIGGNVAHSSGGPGAVKYGTTKDYILNLQVVLPCGDIIWTGANTLKNSTGYNLTQLMIGSEGTLGVVTAMVCKLVAMPTHRVLMWAAFEDAVEACTFIPEVLLKGILPSAIEFMETKAVEIAAQTLHVTVDTYQTQAFVLMELDGFNPQDLVSECEKIYEILEQYQVKSVSLAETSEQQQKLWRIRKVMGEAVKRHSVYKEEDAVVPRYRLPDLFRKVKELEEKWGFEAVCYGHAGDGNLHINILKNQLSDDVWENELPKAIRELFVFCKEVGGTISGEHGIGWVQKKYGDIVFTDTHIRLMQGIKDTFDPRGIMNPGKIWNTI